jgi:hypothetical protein
MSKEVGTFHTEKAKIMTGDKIKYTCSPRPQLFRACNQRNNNIEVAVALTLVIEEELKIASVNAKITQD